MHIDQLAFASRFDGISGSAIREIFKLLAVPGMISFIFCPQHTTGTPLSRTIAMMLPQCSQIKNLCSMIQSSSVLGRALRCVPSCQGSGKAYGVSVSAVKLIYHVFAQVKPQLHKNNVSAEKRCVPDYAPFFYIDSLAFFRSYATIIRGLSLLSDVIGGK